MNDDAIQKLDEVLEEEDLKNGYIGKTVIFKCPACGSEKIVPEKDADEVVCDECQEDMHPVDESLVDEQEVAAIKELGPTEMELLTDDGEEIEIEDSKGLTKEDSGNLIDPSEQDELTIIDPDAIVPEEDEEDVDLENIHTDFEIEKSDVDAEEDVDLGFADGDDDTAFDDDDNGWDSFSSDEDYE